MTDHDPGAVTERPRPRVSLKIEEIIMGVAMAAMALITGANVLTRYLTNVSFAFTEEYSVLLMVIVALVGSSYAMAGGRHIRIGFLVDDMVPRWRRPAEIAAMVLAIACFGVLVVWGGRLAWDEYRFESMTPGLGNPQWIYTGMLPLLSLLVVARAAGRLVRLLRGERT
jgi:TRAP-type C4-dicarboxylate transport system permease small subunit